MDLFNWSLIFCVKTYRNWSLTDFDQGSPSHSINSALSNLYSSIKKFRCLSRHSAWGEKLKPRPFQISAECDRLLVSWNAGNINLLHVNFELYYNAMLSQFLTHFLTKTVKFDKNSSIFASKQCSFISKPGEFPWIWVAS